MDDNAGRSQTFLTVLRPSRVGMLAEGMTFEEERAVAEHFEYLQELAGQGRMLLFGRTDTRDENTFGLVLFEAEDEGAARELVEADPVVRAGVMLAELFPYRLAYLRGVSD